MLTPRQRRECGKRYKYLLRERIAALAQRSCFIKAWLVGVARCLAGIARKAEICLLDQVQYSTPQALWQNGRLIMYDRLSSRFY